MVSWIALGWKLVTRNTKSQLEAWNFQPHLPSAGKGRGAGDGINVRLCQHDEVFIKIPKV